LQNLLTTSEVCQVESALSQKIFGRGDAPAIAHVLGDALTSAKASFCLCVYIDLKICWYYRKMVLGINDYLADM